MKRSFISIILILSLVLSMGTMAYAGGDDGSMPSSARLYINDVEYPLTRDASGSGWSFDSETVTLTLEKFNGGDIHFYSFYGKGLNLRVQLIGDNSAGDIYSTCYDFETDSKGNYSGGGGCFVVIGSGSLSCRSINAPQLITAGEVTLNIGDDSNSALDVKILRALQGSQVNVKANSYNGCFMNTRVIVAGGSTVRVDNRQANALRDFTPEIENGSIIFTAAGDEALQLKGPLYRELVAAGCKFSDASGKPAALFDFSGKAYSGDEWAYVRPVSNPGSKGSYIRISNDKGELQEPEIPDTPATPDEPIAPAPRPSFSDVKTGAWYEETIVAAAQAGIIAGNADGTYNPNGILTWAQTIVFAVRLDQYNKGEHIYGAADQGTPWYKVYVDYALEHGIIRYPVDDYNAPLNRADAATVFARVLGNAEPVNNVPNDYFSDVLLTDIRGEDDELRYASVYTLARYGIVNGMGDGSFGVTGNFTRAQVAAIVARIAGLAAPVIIE